MQAFISSRLDNVNSLLYGLPDYLLYGLPDYQVERLHRIHNTAARSLTQTRKYDHITPILKDLHWLPVRQMIIVIKAVTLTVA